MSIKLRVMCRAVKIRMANGEDLESILATYPKLTDEEKQIIRKEVG